MDLDYYKNTLEQAGVLFAHGLSESEIESIQEKYRFQFPPDLKEFLMFALPISDGFVDWRDATEDEIANRLLWPYEGICFDIENSSFWLEEWGQQPESLDEAFATAKKAVESAPALIPIYIHRYIPDRPNEVGNPVFSVYQTDIIYYGSDLADYLENEFRYYFDRSEYSLTGEIKHIEFWSRLVENGS
ncbi:MAG: SMI1/KNR4 family protein [Blastocatellia bacterium]|nr:SMI1/KNR4 family protein [Blastocatellia bacterium]